MTVQKKKIKIDYAPRRQFLGYHSRKERYAILVCHRRAGKTVATLNDLIMRAATTPNGNFAYIAPFYSQAKDVAWDYLKTRLAEMEKAASLIGQAMLRP